MTILQKHGSPSVSSYVLAEAVKLNPHGNNTGQDRLKEVEDNTNPKKQPHYIHGYHTHPVMHGIT